MKELNNKKAYKINDIKIIKNIIKKRYNLWRFYKIILPCFSIINCFINNISFI